MMIESRPATVVCHKMRGSHTRVTLPATQSASEICSAQQTKILLQQELARSAPIGRPRRFPRSAKQSSKPNRVDRMCAFSYRMRDRPSQDFQIKNGRNGLIVWWAKAGRFRISVRVGGAGNGFALPSPPVW